MRTVIHYPIPIFSSRYREKQKEAPIKDGEVLVLIDCHSLLDSAEHELSKRCKDKEEEHKKHEYIEESCSREQNRVE